MTNARLTVGCPQCGAMVDHEDILSAEKAGRRHTCKGCGAGVSMEAVHVAADLEGDGRDSDERQVQGAS
jgi:ribosomal protein S27AE